MDKTEVRDINNMDHVLSNNAKEFIQVNDVVDNEMKFDSNYILANSKIK